MITEEEKIKIDKEIYAIIRKQRRKRKTALAIKITLHIIWYPLLEIVLAYLNLRSAGLELRANKPMWMVYVSLFLFDACLSVGLMMLKDIYDMLWEIAEI
jgi:hypothetical protein